jgi:chemotaxis protein histidine kinase CheA
VIHDFFQDLEGRMAGLKTRMDALMEESERARQQYPDGRRLEIPEDDVAVIFRDLHTIKGNAGTYGFDQITRLAHRAEEHLEALKPPIKERTSTTIGCIQELLVQMQEAYEDIIKTQQRLGGGGEEALLHIPEHKIEFVQTLTKTLAGDLEHHKAVGEALMPLLDACSHLRDINVVKLVEKYRNMTLRLAERLDKKIEFDIQPQVIELEPHFFAPYDEAITHILRNCVDHGVETHEARVASGKNEIGKIQLGLQFSDDACLFTISDDGGGMDPEKIARKAISSGVITESEAAAMSASEKLRLIFRSGFSTAAAVSDISGRGVGMDAALNCITQQGGRIELKSELGVGTSFLIYLPPRG